MLWTSHPLVTMPLFIFYSTGGDFMVAAGVLYF